MNVAKLKGKMAEQGYTQAKLAKKIAISKSTLSRKLKRGGLSLSIGEMHNIARVLSLSNQEAEEIFLN